MFFFSKKRKRRRAPVPKPPARVRTPAADQQREAYRASFEFPVLYVLDGRSGPRGALATHLSASGMRLVGDEDILDGTLLELRFTLPERLIEGVQVEKEIEQITARGRLKKKIMVPPEPFREITLRAKTVIAFLDVHRGKLMHGLQFVDLDERTAEEIQRFVHVWQIKQLRERAQSRGE